MLNVTPDGPAAGLFSLSGFTSGSILADSADQLMIHYSGIPYVDFATLTLFTDYLAEGGAGTLGQSFTINLVAVPEPGTTAFVCLAALAYAVFHGAYRRHKGIREKDENLGEVENAHTLSGDIE